MALFFKIDTDPGKVNSRQISMTIRRLRALPRSLRVIGVRTWQRVNRFLQDVVRKRFIENRGGIDLKASTVIWKRSAVNRGSVPWGSGVPKKSLIRRYGQLTGTFQQELRRGQTVGGKGRFIRDISAGGFGVPGLDIGAIQPMNSSLRWGIDLSQYNRGYPARILKPKDATEILSTTGGSRSLISVTREEIAVVQRIVYENWFLPAIRKSLSASVPIGAIG